MDKHKFEPGAKANGFGDAFGQLYFDAFEKSLDVSYEEANKNIQADAKRFVKIYKEFYNKQPRGKRNLKNHQKSTNKEKAAEIHKLVDAFLEEHKNEVVLSLGDGLKSGKPRDMRILNIESLRKFFGKEMFKNIPRNEIEELLDMLQKLTYYTEGTGDSENDKSNVSINDRKAI